MEIYGEKGGIMLYHCLSNWKINNNSMHLPIHLYSLKIEDVNNRHQQHYETANMLSKLNDWQVIIFYDRYIASFSQITKWGELQYVDYTYRPINNNNSQERKVLERLLLKHIEKTKYASQKYNALNGKFIAKEEKVVGDICIRPCINMSCNVDESGNIFVGCDYTHRFSRKDNITNLVEKGLLKKGDLLTDRFRKQYEFVRQDERTIHDYIEELGQSIFEYYQDRKESSLLRNAPQTTKLVVVQAVNSQKELLFAPQLLFEECSFENIPSTLQRSINNIIKLSAHEKMSQLKERSFEILNACNYTKVTNSGFLAHNQGYYHQRLQPPLLKFGKEKISQYPNKGLLTNGVFSEVNQPLKLHFFVDDKVVKNMKDKNSSERYQFEKFVKDIVDLSDQLHVPIEQVNIGNKIGYGDFTFADNYELRKKLKSISEIFEYTTVIILNKSNKDAYETIKKELSGKASIPIQIVYFDTMNLEYGRQYALLNILLGIYAKSGIQPWILKEPLSSDCYIGLDVSHEKGKHAAGIVQVVGRDGRVLKSKAIQGNESGEKISRHTIDDILHEAIYSYEKEYGSLPKSFVFHRDGKGHKDEISAIQDLLSKENIPFNYIAIKKTVNRRMATFDLKSNQWKTIQGMSYIKGKEAYMCTTNPREKVGMAEPIKVEHLYGEAKMEQILKDIYALSFMHIGALNKSRLPITVHYADKSSTFFNRGMQPTDGWEKVLYFV